MPNLKWYYHRLQAMSPAEICWRFRTETRKRIWKHRVLTNRFSLNAPLPPVEPPVDPWLTEPHRIEVARSAAALLHEADASLHHRWNFFELDGVPENPVDWHRDPKANITAPKVFGFDIDHRDDAAVGNIKITWEKSRHHHLTQLAAAFALTRDNRYANEAVTQLLDWVAENPFMIGVNWTHPLESGIRLIAWVWCERLLRGAQRHAEAFGPASPLWPCVEGHARLIEAFYSRYSSANNHLIGEISGLFVAACAWPWIHRAGKRRNLAQRMLEREIVRQTFPSGLNRELATGYQWFVAEFLMLARIEADNAGCFFSKHYDTLLRNMLEIMPNFADLHGNFPAFGDDDEGRAILLDARSAPRWEWLFAAARQFLDAHVPEPAMPPLTIHFLKWSGMTAPTLQPDRASSHRTTECLAPSSTVGGFGDIDAGRFAMRTVDASNHEILVCVDAGPLGFLSIAAHGHADALSFTLNFDGHPVFIDPGTYAYHTDLPWRQYFRGTAAHNTIRVDGLDQSEPVGAFSWKSKARCRILSWQPDSCPCMLKAEHDGFVQRSGVMHRRTFILDRKKLILEDKLDGSGRHDIEWRLHVHPDWTITLNTADAVLTPITAPRQSESGPMTVRPLKLALDPKLKWRLGRASKDSGWYSPVFGCKLPAFTLIGQSQQPLPLELNNHIGW